jgi:DNA-binding Lrp family transcriptional regulator
VRRLRPVELDEIDHELLALLQEDAGRTLRELGDTVRLSPSAVQRRIGRYQETGLMARKVAVLDSQRVGGMLLAIVLIALGQESTERHDALRARLLAASEVQQCYASPASGTMSSCWSRTGCRTVASSSPACSSTIQASSAVKRFPFSTLSSSASACRFHASSRAERRHRLAAALFRAALRPARTGVEGGKSHLSLYPVAVVVGFAAR